MRYGTAQYIQEVQLVMTYLNWEVKRALENLREAGGQEKEGFVIISGDPEHVVGG